jgi:type II secretory pathway component PulC
MIRKLFMLGAVLALFLYTVWNFYAEALSYDPLSAVSVKQPKVIGPEQIVSAYRTAWSREIQDKNLFSPARTYFVPKPVPVSVPVPPPRRPELALRGIVLNTFGEYVGFIEIDKAKAVPMRKGDKIADIEVIDISERKVVLQWNNEKIDLSIEKIKTLSRPRMR